MKYWRVKQFFILMIVWVSIASYADTTDQSIALKQFSQLLGSFQTYQGDYTQVVTDETGTVVQRGSGRMIISKPGRFRWEINQPTKQIIMTDGRELWIYDVDLAQVTKQSLDKKTNINPATLLSGSAEEIAKNFNVQMKVSGNKQSFLIKPKRSDLSFQWMSVTFQNNQIVSMVILNNLNQTTTYTFSNIKMNQKLSPDLFRYKPMSGVDVITQ